MSVKPPPVFTCHCTVGVGTPLAEAVKLAVWPAATVTDWGSPVIVGGVAAVVVKLSTSPMPYPESPLAAVARK